MTNKTTESKNSGALAKKKLNLLALASLTTLACTQVFAADLIDAQDKSGGTTHYQQINLVADLAGVAQLQDTNLVNAWGVSAGATGPFWVGDNGTGNATLYAVTNDAAGAPHAARNARVVSIPNTGGVTGLFANTTPAFNGDAFVFVSEDGTISGWRGALGNAAEVLAARNGAVYKGVAQTTNAAGPVLLAANFSEGTLDEYDATLTLINQFVDRSAPAGYAPFNVANVNGTIFVTFAKQDATKHDDSAGRGHGLIDIFTLEDGTFLRFAAGKAAGGRIHEMDSPWGMALAPASFGTHADQLLVGNFGSGTIMTFDADGRFHGLLKGSKGGALSIDGLWSLRFGTTGTAGVTNDLYFSAGPKGESHGLFGVLQKQN